MLRDLPYGRNKAILAKQRSCMSPQCCGASGHLGKLKLIDSSSYSALAAEEMLPPKLQIRTGSLGWELALLEFPEPPEAWLIFFWGGGCCSFPRSGKLVEWREDRTG